MGKLLRLEEVAARLKISYFKARNLILRHGSPLPYITVGSRGIRVDEAELEKYIQGLKQTEVLNGSPNNRESKDSG